MFPTLPNCPGGGGGGAPLVPSRISVVLVEETNAGDTSQPECPCDDQEKQPLAGTNRPRRRPVRVEELAVVNVPVLTIQDPLAAAGAVVLDCRPPLLPVSMDIKNNNLLAVSAGMDVLLPGREPLSNGGGGTC